MMQHGYGIGAGWILLVLALVVSIAVASAALLMMRSRHDPAALPAAGPTLGAEKILDDRLARGEIDVDEYTQRLLALRTEHR